MRDIHATTSRSSNQDRVSAVAASKLKSISGASISTADGSGLIDAFAEVFARMAVATPSTPD